MKLLSRFGAMLLALALLCALTVPAFAATINDTTIDHDAKCALTLYKYDITAAEADGFVPGSVVSTGQSDSSAEAALAPYAVQGVEFTYVRIADLITYSFQESGGYGRNSSFLQNKKAGALTPLLHMRLLPSQLQGLPALRTIR